MIALFVAIFPLLTNPANAALLAIAFNQTGKSTSTSNPQEDHIRKGAELALNMKHSPVQWIDHGESVTQTLEAINQINNSKPRVVVGMGNSFQALLAADRMSHDTVLISPVATADAIVDKKKNILLLSNVNSIQGRILAFEIKARSRNQDRVLIVELAGCPYCVDMSVAAEKALRALKLSPVKVRIHISQINDLPNPLSAQNGFAHIVLPVFEADAARLIAILHPNNPKTIFWGSDGWGNLARYIRELPIAKMVQAVWISHYHPSVDTRENRRFVREFRKTYGADPVDTSALYFEAIRIAQNLVRVPSPQERMSAFARLVEYRGLTGPVKVMNDHVSRPMPLMELVAGEPRLIKMVSARDKR